MRAWRVLALGAVGIAAGLVTLTTWPKADGWLIADPFWPGVTFGLLVGGMLVALRLTTISRALGFAAGSTASWHVAVLLSVAPVDAGWDALVVGLVAGGIGAAGLGATACMLWPAFQKGHAFAVMLVVGSASGGLLLRNGDSDLRLLFAVWQGAVAFVLGWGLTKP